MVLIPSIIFNIYMCTYGIWLTDKNDVTCIIIVKVNKNILI